MKYKASLDILAKIITVGATVIIAVVIYNQVVVTNGELSEPSLLIRAISILIYVCAFLFRPVCYEITEKHLIVHWPLKNIVTDRKLITSIEQPADAILQKSVRVFGSGGFFGYFGKYANSQYSTMNWYASRRSQAVIIYIAATRKIVLTPDNPEAFIRELNN